MSAQGCHRIKWPRTTTRATNRCAGFYNIVPIDAPSTKPYVEPHRKCAAGGFTSRVCAGKFDLFVYALGSLRFQLRVETRLDATKYFLTCPHRQRRVPTAGQSSATEIGIFLDNCPRCLPGHFEISRGLRGCKGQTNPPV